MMMETFNGNWQLHMEQFMGMTHSTFLGKCTPTIFQNVGQAEKVMFLAFVELNETDFDKIHNQFNLNF